MKNIFVKAIICAIRNGFSSVGIFWSCFEILGYYFPTWAQLVGNHVWVMISVFVISALITFICQIRVKVTHTICGKEIVIKPGNIIREKSGSIVVGVNSQMMTGEGELAENSIHHQLVRKYGQPALEQLFSQAKSKNGDYPFFRGTLGNKRFIFLCMSDVHNGVASTTKQQLGQALSSLFENQKEVDIHKRKIYFPVLGTGGSGIGMSKQEMIKYLIESFLDFQRNKTDVSIDRIEQFNVVVYWYNMTQIDWKELNTWLKTYNDYCLNCKRTSTQ